MTTQREVSIGPIEIDDCETDHRQTWESVCERPFGFHFCYDAGARMHMSWAFGQHGERIKCEGYRADGRCAP